MKREISVEAKKAQFMVEKAMDDITRATRKVLMDYVSRMYVTSFAKAITYLGLESEDAIDLLDNMDYDTRRQVKEFAKEYQRSDAQVISEVEHIVTTSGMDFYAKPFVQTLFSKNNELSSHRFCLQSVCYQTCFVNFIRCFVAQPLMNPFTIEELYKFPETFSQFLCA